MNRVVLVHGKDKTPRDVWYPWLAGEVQRSGVEFVAPVLTVGSIPILSEWLAAIDQTAPNEETVLIGHSRGGMAILRWLERAPEECRVGRVILVAANRGDSPDAAGGDFFYGGDYDFAKIKQHCDDFVVIHSRDDQWVPFEAGEHNAEGLGARFMTFEDKGHFAGDMKDFPELLKVVLTK